MKQLTTILAASFIATAAFAAAPDAGKTIRISPDNTDLILKVGDNGRLYQTYLGPKFLHEADVAIPGWTQYAASDGAVCTRGWEAYSTSGNEDFFEPALGITHADGNMTTYLYYTGSSTEKIDGGTLTRINLRDNKYPVDVTLFYAAYPAENVIKTWTEISHQEKKPITMQQYASAMLYFNEPEYWLTEFSGDWAKEAGMSSQQLQYGKKIIDTKLGSRAAMHTSPFFEVGLDGSVRENSGEVLMGTLGWTGNFRFTFEVDNVGNLRVISGINPYASNYELKAGEVFTTPEWLFGAKAWDKAYAQRSSPVGQMEYAPYNFARELQYKTYYELLADQRLVRMYEVEARQGRGAKTYTPEQMMDDITRAVFIRPGGRSLSIWERMSQKNYVDALIVSSNLTMVKTTKLGSTLRDHAHDGRGCTCSLMQDAPELNLEPLPRPEEIGLRTARNYDMMQRVSETTSAKRAEMRRLLTVVQGRFQSGDQATRNHYRDLELRLKEALRML